MGTGERGLKRLIVTGDDFGLSIPVNEAIESAHRDGILTATCLMVGAPAVADAVARASRLPKLAVGLHVVLARGRPILPPADVPALVDGSGRFDDKLIRAGLRYFFLPRARRQIAAEIRAQFEAFRATGLQLDHVNAHNHLHMHPTILGLILRIGRDYGLKAVRLPFEPAPQGDIGQRIRTALLRLWIAPMKRRLRRAGIAYNDYVFGLHDSGGMDRERMQALLSRLPEGTSEIFMHPATRSWDDMDPAAAAYRFEAEYAALIDSDVRAAVARSGAALIAFRDLR
jgi:hopanoid biosynthesis associated protein HpnK